jgi:antitoxin (DNA-binding transcriptional repressor) of toxin-antitoxin stability system
MKQVTVAELQENLAKHLDEVRRGETITVFADDEAVATIAPTTDLRVIRGDHSKRLSDIDLGPPLKHPLDFDAAQLVIEERDRERLGKKW